MTVTARERPPPSARTPIPGVPDKAPLSKEEFLAKKAQEESATQSNDMLLAVNAIFNEGKNDVVLKSGKTVTIRPATMGQLPLVMLFFGDVMVGIDPSNFALLVDSIVHTQKLAIARGEDPNNIDLRELATDELVSKAFNHTSLLSLLLSAVFQHLPKLVTAFTNLTEEEFRSLELDEGALVAGGIFTLNYSFFTQSLLPILTAFMQSWASKSGKTLKGSQKKNTN